MTPVVLLQVSDAHFGTEHAPVADALRALAHEQRTDVTVWTGDLTQRARPAQFAAARRYADSLPGVQVAMPGNHDIPLYDVVRRALRPYARFRHAFGPVLEPELERDDMLLLLVDTTRRWRHKHGQLSRAQVERVAARLARASPAQLRIVATHQPLHALAAEDAHHRVRAPRETLARWADAGADLVLGGHTHRPRCARVAAGHRPVWVVQAGTSLSSRVRGGLANSVNLVRHDAPARRCVVERWDYDSDTRRFVRAHAEPIVLVR